MDVDCILLLPVKSFYSELDLYIVIIIYNFTPIMNMKLLSVHEYTFFHFQ